MSEVMLLGVLRMPPKLWDNGNPIDELQRYSRYCEAADKLEKIINILETNNDTFDPCDAPLEKLDSIKTVLEL